MGAACSTQSNPAAQIAPSAAPEAAPVLQSRAEPAPPAEAPAEAPAAAAGPTSVFAKLGDAVHTAADTVAGATKKAASNVAEAATDNVLTKKASELKEEVKDKAGAQYLEAEDKRHESEFAAIKKTIDTTVPPAVEKALTSDPWAPKWLGKAFRKVWADSYPKIMEVAKEIYMSDKGSNAQLGASEAATLKDPKLWPPPPPFSLKAPLTWLRCQMLYSINPADKSLWYVVTTPVPRIMLILSVLPIFGISTMFWLVFALFMSKNDEYQITSYIATTKTLWLVTYGVLPVLAGYFKFAACYTFGTCEEMAPGVAVYSLLTVYCLFLNRVAGYVVFVRYLMLRKKRMAEANRVGMTADTKLTKVKIKELAHQLSDQISHEDRLHPCCCLAPPRKVSDKLGLLRLQAALQQGEGRCFVTIFMIWDISVFLINCVVFALIATHFADGVSSPQARVALEACGIITELLSAAPWILFLVPGISYVLLKVARTGYDEAGGIKLVLSANLKKKKFDIETGNTTKDKAKAGIKKIGNAADGVKDKGKEKVNAAATKTAEVGGKVKEKAKTGAGKVAEMV